MNISPVATQRLVMQAFENTRGLKRELSDIQKTLGLVQGGAMTLYELLQYSPIAHAVGMTLLHFVWQGIVVALAVGCALAYLRRGDPKVRYAVCCVALLVMTFLPVATFSYLYATADYAGPPVVPSRVYALIDEANARDRAEMALATRAYAASDSGSSETKDDVVAESPGAGAQATPETAEANGVESKGFSLEIPWEKVNAFCYTWAPWLSVFWGFGVALLTVRLMGALYFTARLRRRYATALGGHWQETVDRLRGQLGISRAVALLQSGRVLVPTMMGWLRPVILLPASALTGLTPGQIEALLAHELAHIRRHDYLVNLLQNVVETLLFYHPAVWWVSKQIRDERELCCDDIVLEVCGEARVYATALCDMLTLRMENYPTALFASGGSLPNRLRRMLGLATPTPGRMSRGMAGTIVVALLFTVSTFFVLRSASAREIDPETVAQLRRAIALRDEAPTVGQGHSQGAYILRRNKLEEALTILEGLAQEYPEVVEYRGELGITLLNLSVGCHMAAEESLEIRISAASILEAVSQAYATKSMSRKYRDQLARTYQWLGRDFEILDRMPEAVEAARHAVEIERELADVEPHNPVYRGQLGKYLMYLGMLQAESGDPQFKTFREAWRHFETAHWLEVEYGAVGVRIETAVEAYGWIYDPAELLYRENQPDEAVELYGLALDSFEGLAAAEPFFHVDRLMVQEKYAAFLQHIGRPAEAKQAKADGEALRNKMLTEFPGLFQEYRELESEIGLAVDGPLMDYRVRISTPGEYRLYVRNEAHDLYSCGALAFIEELADGAGGDFADLYLFSCNSERDMDADFATDPWDSVGRFEFERERPEVPMVWSISTPGDYTVRFCGDEDGVALDAFVLQRASLPPPESDGPAESSRTADGVFLEEGGRVTVEAEHYAAKTPVKGKEWLVVPTEDPGDIPHANARGGAYLQTLPDSTPSNEDNFARTVSEQDNPDAWLVAANLYSIHGEYEDTALEQFRRVEDDVPSSTSPAYGWFFMAMAHHRLGHRDEAREFFEGAVAQADRELKEGVEWNRRATLNLLRNEAEALLNIAEVKFAGS